MNGVMRDSITVGNKVEEMRYMANKIAENINILGEFCGKRDVWELSHENLEKKYGFEKADVMVLFGGSIISGGDVLAKAIKEEVAKTYVIVGGAGHTTAEEVHSGNSSYVLSLRRQLETIGKIYSYENLGHLFINTDTPPETKAEFRVYSDAELKRLNAEITKMDVQIARCLLIHQMLGTRISDTLTLRTNCLTEENGQYMVEIYQVKTKRYKKPVSRELARLLQRSIEYTQERFQDTKYIFVNEKNPDRPIQYMAIKSKVMSMIQEKQLKDDNGKLFGFGTHMFRHYYGVKLTEMHVDDWTIARLLGHKRLNSVKHYRKMSNQRMADETREVRQMMSNIIYSILDGWGEEYEQIRQDD